MKTTLKNALTILTVVFFLTFCSEDNSEGSNAFELERENGPTSYRYHLWKMLIDNEYQFDLIGTRSDPGNYPSYAGKSFDTDHEGIGGIETEGVLSNLPKVLAAIATPDVVLLGIGGNDLLRRDEPVEPIENIRAIIVSLQQINPSVTILLEQIAPGRSNVMVAEFASKFTDFNDRIATLAANQTNDKSRVIIVKMYDGFSDDFLADNVHYNERGAAFIAGKYMAAIEKQVGKSSSLNILTLGDSRVQGRRQ